MPADPILVNVERLHHYMDEAGCAAIVSRSGTNFTYLTGVAYPGTLGRRLDFPDAPCDVFCIWPRSGEPVVVTTRSGQPLTKRDSWVKRIVASDDYVETGIECMAKVLRELGLDKEKLGFEMTYISTIPMGGDRERAARCRALRLHVADGRGALDQDAGGGGVAAPSRRDPGPSSSGGLPRGQRGRHRTPGPRRYGRSMHGARLRLRARRAQLEPQPRHLLRGGRRRLPRRRHPSHRLRLLLPGLSGASVAAVLPRPALR